MELFLFSSMYDSIVNHNNTNNVEKIDIIQNVDSIQWMENFQSVGTFYLELMDKNISEYLTPGRCLLREDTNTYALIKTVNKVNGRVIVTGMFDALEYVVNTTTKTITNSYDGLYSLLNTNGRNNLTYTRNANTVRVATDSYETTWETLGDSIIELCKKTNTGYKLVGASSVLIYQGNELDDLSISDTTDDIYNESLTLDNSEAVNIAYVAGEDSGSSRIVEKVINPTFAVNSDEAYREIYVDARDIQKEDGMSDTAYRLLLRERGLKKLQDQNRQTIFKCEFNPNRINGIVYRKDFNVGDIIPVWSKRFNRRTKMRVVSATEVLEPKNVNNTRVIIDLEEV